MRHWPLTAVARRWALRWPCPAVGLFRKTKKTAESLLEENERLKSEMELAEAQVRAAQGADGRTPA